MIVFFSLISSFNVLSMIENMNYLLTDEEVERYHHDGYLVVKNLFDRAGDANLEGEDSHIIKRRRTLQ